jgi:hypothetical protein
VFEITGFVAEDLTGGLEVLQIDHHHAQGRDELLAPDEKVEIPGDLKIMTAIGIGMNRRYDGKLC